MQDYWRARMDLSDAAKIDRLEALVMEAMRRMKRQEETMEKLLKLLEDGQVLDWAK